jgi:hypothetical protein
MFSGKNTVLSIIAVDPILICQYVFLFQYRFINNFQLAEIAFMKVIDELTFRNSNIILL